MEYMFFCNYALKLNIYDLRLFLYPVSLITSYKLSESSSRTIRGLLLKHFFKIRPYPITQEVV